VIRFEVLGTPAPKGSARAINIRGRARLIASGSNANRKALVEWDRAVRGRVDELLGGRGTLFMNAPLEVHLVFRLERPKSHYGSGRNAGVLKDSAPRWHTVKPDADKLARAVLDSLTEVDQRPGLFDDDARIPILVSQKEWADRGHAGVNVTVRELAIAPSDRRGVVEAQGYASRRSRARSATRR
jgi:Holliday junction resolvase RusA-like endonuclease